MTSEEWMVSANPVAMLQFLLPHHPRDRVGGQLPSSQFSLSDYKLRCFVDAAKCPSCERFFGDHNVVWRATYVATAECGSRAMKATQADLLREIIGNPWRPVTLPKSRVRCDWCDATGEVMDGGSHGYNRTYETCPSCNGEGWREGPCPWLTPTVVSLATAAYQERPGRVCEECKGMGEVRSGHPLSWKDCPICGDLGRIENGRLDNARLAVLADALELDAGMPETVKCERCDGYGGTAVSSWLEDGWKDCSACKCTGSVPNPILQHLRSDGGHVRGCWVLDLLLGKA